MAYPQLIEKVIAHFAKLPGIGRRSAERMAFWLLNHPEEEAQQLARSIVDLKKGLRVCCQYNNFSEGEYCEICNDQTRDHSVICVVENPKDVLAIEKTASYQGQYHVLLGAISPAEGRGPEHLKLNQLFARINAQGINEVLIATDPDNEGEMTALYLIKQLKNYDVKISRIGLGLPVGGTVEYADQSSLSMALASRRIIEKDIQ